MRSPRPKGGRGPLIPGVRGASRPTRLGMRPAQRPPRPAGISRCDDPGPPDSNGYPPWRHCARRGPARLGPRRTIGFAQLRAHRSAPARPVIAWAPTLDPLVLLSGIAALLA